MNNKNCLFHLKEAREELEKIISKFESKSIYHEAQYEVAMSHLYYHLNTAWNSRNATAKQLALKGKRGEKKI